MLAPLPLQKTVHTESHAPGTQQQPSALVEGLRYSFCICWPTPPPPPVCASTGLYKHGTRLTILVNFSVFAQRGGGGGGGGGGATGCCFNFPSGGGGGGGLLLGPPPSLPKTPFPPPPSALIHLRIRLLGTFFFLGLFFPPAPSAHLQQGTLVTPLHPFFPLLQTPCHSVP